ncbi:SLAP domain-containing protein [Lactobacillus crispatus]|uniref:SLAP domain-containing protein n=1 Tax=Lactobacillus crispatus TaxID=47770 RepID=UPI0030FB0933
MQLKRLTTQQTLSCKLPSAQAQQKLQDILDAEYAQSIIASTPVETKKEDKQEPVKTPEVAKETETKTKVSTAPKKIRLTHNAFVYNKHGKLIRKGLYVKLLKCGKTIKALKNAKIVTIKGKKYYQIGKNQFIKVANTKLTTHAVHLKARIKGNKKTKAYNHVGKFNKHYASPNHTYTFNEKAKINGKTYYKIAGTNNWIPAKKLALKK